MMNILIALYHEVTLLVDEKNRTTDIIKLMYLDEKIHAVMKDINLFERKLKFHE